MKQPSGLKNVFSCASLKCPSVEVTESDFLSRPRTRASKSPIVLLRPESLFPSLLRLIEELLTTCYILQHVTCDWKDPENKLGEFFSLIKPHGPDKADVSAYFRLHQLPRSISVVSIIAGRRRRPSDLTLMPASFATFNQYSHTARTVCHNLCSCWDQLWVLHSVSVCAQASAGCCLVTRLTAAAAVAWKALQNNKKSQDAFDGNIFHKETFKWLWNPSQLNLTPPQ